jgi:AraC-like DNA-binding protein
MSAQTESFAVISRVALEARIQHFRTTAEIAQELEVSVKQVRGALRDLAESGIHIPTVVVHRTGQRQLRWPCSPVDNRCLRLAVDRARQRHPELSLRELARRAELSDRALARHLGIVRHSRTRIGQKRYAGQFATQMPSDVAATIVRALGLDPTDLGL